MIKLNAIKAPAVLTFQKIKELTKEYLRSGKSVWNVDFIKSTLSDISHHKCAYCECALNRESNFMEVEHFYCKKDYPLRVVIWKNLLPACKRCNGTKGDHDVAFEPIIHPVNDNPRDHIVLRDYWYHGRTNKGVMTIDVLKLNNIDRAVKPRADLGFQIYANIDALNERLQHYYAKASARKLSALRDATEALLVECQPEASYSASSLLLFMAVTYIKILSCR